MNDEDKKQDLIKSDSGPPMEIRLGQNTLVDLTGLSEEDARELRMEFNRGMLDINLKAMELKVDTAVLKQTLNDMSDTTRDVAESDNAVTISHTQTSKVGRTEIIMGNTQQAVSGKLSKSQTGQRDWTPYYIFGAFVAAIIIALLIRN